MSTIKKALKIILSNKKKVDSVISVKKSKEVILRLKKNFVLHSNKIRRRQDRNYTFFEASTLWAFKFKSLLLNKSIIGKYSRPLFVDQLETIDINEPEDMKIAQPLIKKFFK